MFLAEVIGHIVATKKDESMRGKKLLLLDEPAIPNRENAVRENRLESATPSTERLGPEMKWWCD